MINKITFFRILAVFTVAVIYLPVFRFNVPNSFSFLVGYDFILALWVLCVLLTNKRVYSMRLMVVFYVFIFVLLFGTLTFWSSRTVDSHDQISIGWVLRDVGGFFLASLVFLVFIKTADYKGLSLLAIITIVLVAVTSIISIAGITIHPGVVRQMAGKEQPEFVDMYNKIGIARYQFFGSLIVLSPVLGYIIRKGRSQKVKALSILMLLIFLYALIKSEFSTAIFLFIFFFVASFFAVRNTRKAITLYVVIFILIIFIFNQFIANILFYIANNYELGSTLNYRIHDIGETFLYGDFDSGSDKTYFARSRLALIQMSINNFLQNPLIGNDWGGGHSSWFDRLGLYGILGLVPWAIVYLYHIRINMSLLKKDFHTYYMLSAFTIVILGMLTTTANSFEISIMLFVVIPGLFFHIENYGKTKTNMADSA